ncbi:CRISPR-associated endonuclease Cas1 [Leptolyngbya sp. KIOST-1]|uniref:CRISPR-associated endonuclease Cas1 n=1 Tax=Leptolyngbya sp. KIOST-1 TaxID=1229172 RepID=UPI0006903AF5
MLSLLHLEGLNPYLGNLHRNDRHEAHLAFDLMEEFRSPIVDTLVLTLLNQQVLKPDAFLPPKANGAVYLTDDARRRYLQAFEDRIMTTLHHPDARDPVPYFHSAQRSCNLVLKAVTLWGREFAGSSARVAAMLT